MLAAWARGTDGDLFPLCRSTAFKLTFGESIKKRHSVGSCWCPRVPTVDQKSLQNIRSFCSEKISLDSFQRLRKEHISVSCWRIFHVFSLELRVELLFLDKFKSRTRLLRSPYVNKLGSDKEQLSSNVGSQSTLSSSYYPWSSSESVMSLLEVRLYGGFGTGNSSLCGTGLIADGKSGYFTVCLDLEVISLMSVEQKQQLDESSFGSLQNRGRAKGIWGESLTMSGWFKHFCVMMTI